ncbi:MAG: hypothetical protein ABI588_11485 [Arenimonas sp.]
MTASAGIMGLLGSVHLLYTFRGNKLFPRDTHLERQMAQVSPVLTRHTTMWLAWIGFNASHSMGAMFFGLMYGYLALAQPALLFGSPFLVALGFAMLAGYTLLAKEYWFRIPLTGTAMALALYCAAVFRAWMG